MAEWIGENVEIAKNTKNTAIVVSRSAIVMLYIVEDINVCRTDFKYFGKIARVVVE